MEEEMQRDKFLTTAPQVITDSNIVWTEKVQRAFTIVLLIQV